MIRLLAQKPLNKSYSNLIVFGAGNNSNNPEKNKIPEIKYHTNPERKPISLPEVSEMGVIRIIENANKLKLSVDDYLRLIAPSLFKPDAEPSVTVPIGNVNLTTLIDADQIFSKTLEYLKSAQKSIQVEMFEFQNLEIDGKYWGSNGAETITASKKQQKILQTLLDQKRKNPNLKVQIILDAHKWYINGEGQKVRHYGNMDMIKYLKENGIDVVPYPKEIQKGTRLQHVKFLAVDGEKAIVGGMNWGTHSVANHDACVALQKQAGKENSEVDNLIDRVFNPDWKFAWRQIAEEDFTNSPLTEEEQNFIDPDTGKPKYGGIRRAILPEDKEYMEKVGDLFNTPEAKTRFDLDELDLTPVKPMENPAINIFINRPRDYIFINDEIHRLYKNIKEIKKDIRENDYDNDVKQERLAEIKKLTDEMQQKSLNAKIKGEESTGDYIKQRLETATSLRAELFALTHKEIVQKIISRYNEAKNGGRPFDVEIIVDPNILEDFPFCQTPYSELQEAGIPIRQYKVSKDINQRAHSKWAVFDNSEVLIGSANWSAVGLESNIKKGLRNDYPITNANIDDTINKYKGEIYSLEKELGLSSVYNNSGKINYPKLVLRRRAIQDITKQIRSSYKIDRYNLLSDKDVQVMDLEFGDKVKIQDYKSKRAVDIYIDLSKNENKNKLLKLHALYKKIKIFENKKNNYQRGNHEILVNFNNEEVAKTFIRQFDKDWDHSLPIKVEQAPVKLEIIKPPLFNRFA